MQSPPVSDDECIVRMTFTPEHYQEGKFLPTAVSLDDLRSRGFSVDREGITTTTVILQRVNEHKQKKPDVRAFPLFSKLECWAVRAEKDAEGQVMFIVEASPVDGNDGHAEIRSSIQRGDGSLRKLRTKLIEHMNKNIVSLEDLTFSEG